MKINSRGPSPRDSAFQRSVARWVYAVAAVVVIGLTLLTGALRGGFAAITPWVAVRASAVSLASLAVFAVFWTWAFDRMRSPRTFHGLLFATIGICGQVVPWLAFGDTPAGKAAPTLGILLVFAVLMALMGVLYGAWQARRDARRARRGAR